MDGVHDLGGKEGHGPVVVERDEPIFHFDWERRVWGLTTGTFVARFWNGGQFRHTIERMDPVHYLTSRYYEHWLTAVATTLVESGRASVAELEARAGGAVPRSLPVVAVEGEQPGPSSPADGFAVGDRVRVRSWSPRGHTRCPQYVRGKAGVVVRVDGPASLPDLEAHSEDRRQEPVCCVRFESAELWGTGRDAVHVDLWSSYLEAA